MKIKLIKWIPAALALCLAVMAAMGRGQAPAPSGPPDANGNRMYGHGPEGGGPDGGGGNFVRFVGAEAMLGDKLITGSPFSADVVNEFKRTLSDGTLVDRKTTGKIARDSQGRTRRENDAARDRPLRRFRRADDNHPHQRSGCPQALRPQPQRQDGSRTRSRSAFWPHGQ